MKIYNQNSARILLFTFHFDILNFNYNGAYSGFAKRDGRGAEPQARRKFH